MCDWCEVVNATTHVPTDKRLSIAGGREGLSIRGARHHYFFFCFFAHHLKRSREPGLFWLWFACCTKEDDHLTLICPLWEDDPLSWEPWSKLHQGRGFSGSRLKETKMILLILPSPWFAVTLIWNDSSNLQRAKIILQLVQDLGLAVKGMRISNQHTPDHCPKIRWN